MKLKMLNVNMRNFIDGAIATFCFYLVANMISAWWIFSYCPLDTLNDAATPLSGIAKVIGDRAHHQFSIVLNKLFIPLLSGLLARWKMLIYSIRTVKHLPCVATL